MCTITKMPASSTTIAGTAAAIRRTTNRAVTPRLLLAAERGLREESRPRPDPSAARRPRAGRRRLDEPEVRQVLGDEFLDLAVDLASGVAIDRPRGLIEQRVDLRTPVRGG